jgi:hypothetical protein
MVDGRAGLKRARPGAAAAPKRGRSASRRGRGAPECVEARLDACPAARGAVARPRGRPAAGQTVVVDAQSWTRAAPVAGSGAANWVDERHPAHWAWGFSGGQITAHAQCEWAPPARARPVWRRRRAAAAAPRAAGRWQGGRPKRTGAPLLVAWHASVPFQRAEEATQPASLCMNGSLPQLHCQGPQPTPAPALKPAPAATRGAAKSACI